MTESRAPRARTTRPRGTTALLILNLVIMLSPPIYLGLTNGSMASALGYVFGAAGLLLMSLFLLAAVDHRRGRVDR